jgi:ABC-type nitrate/sulfonate/bicarbonate transport system ATPase subunit
MSTPNRRPAEQTVQRGAHIKVSDISHRYRGGADIISNVQFEIEPGELVALIGRSGCGKSTLLHVLAGLIKPTSGEVWIDGVRVSGPSPQRILMFQQPSLFPWLTVAQNVALGLRFTGRSHEARARVAELLRLVELSEFAGRNVQDLSGGQQQRVALARSLAPSPEALLLDEPFSSLDTFTRAGLQRDVRRIARELGLTVVIVTHDIDEAAVVADRALIMAADPGRLQAEVVLRSSQTTDGFQHARSILAAAYEQAAGRQIVAAASGWTN